MHPDVIWQLIVGHPAQYVLFGVLVFVLLTYGLSKFGRDPNYMANSPRRMLVSLFGILTWPVASAVFLFVVLTGVVHIPSSQPTTSSTSSAPRS